MFQQMVYFIAIVKNNSFTKAAEECNISQSAISQQMKELESSLGVSLLERKGRSFTVTDAGKYFYTHSQDILEDVNQLINNTVKIVKDDQINLKVGYLRSFGTTEFLRAVSEFNKQYPQVKINITSGNHEDLYQLLRSGQIDMNFADQRRALSNKYVNEFLTDSKFMVAVSRSSFQSLSTKISSEQLTDMTCILVSGDDELESDKSYYQDILGIRSEFKAVKTLDEAQILVASNQGYLIVNDRTQGQLNLDAVKTLELVNGRQTMSQKYYAYWKADNSGYYIETFADLLKKNFA